MNQATETTHDGTPLAPLMDFLSREFAAGAAVRADQKLFPDLVDSLGIFVLVEFIQQHFGVSIEDTELSAEHLATPRSLSELIARKRC